MKLLLVYKYFLVPKSIIQSIIQPRARECSCGPFMHGHMLLTMFPGVIRWEGRRSRRETSPHLRRTHVMTGQSGRDVFTVVKSMEWKNKTSMPT